VLEVLLVISKDFGFGEKQDIEFKEEKKTGHSFYVHFRQNCM
jgi:hypothetical protein